jgi:hypothetical protein
MQALLMQEGTHLNHAETGLDNMICAQSKFLLLFKLCIHFFFLNTRQLKVSV